MDLVDAALVDVFRKLSHGQAAWPLFLYGTVGTGKTCAALALSDLVVTDWFGTVENAIDVIMQRDTRRWESDPAMRCFNPPPAGSSPLVVLDEVGARQKVSDLAYATIKGFADIRELDFGRVAIYISNLEPDAISRVYDDRIASRLLCGTWYKLEGSDRRMGQ